MNFETRHHVGTPARAQMTRLASLGPLGEFFYIFLPLFLIVSTNQHTSEATHTRRKPLTPHFEPPSCISTLQHPITSHQHTFRPSNTFLEPPTPHCEPPTPLWTCHHSRNARMSNCTCIRLVFITRDACMRNCTRVFLFIFIFWLRKHGYE